MVKFHPVRCELAVGPTICGWCTKQNHEEVIVFVHGNGLAGRVYEPLHQLLAQRYDLLILDLPGHGSSVPYDFVGWNQTAEHVYQVIQASDDFIAGRNLYSVGHSLGGMLSMLAESAHPNTFKAMAMLDPIMFPPVLLMVMRVFYPTPLVKVFHPLLKSTLNRRKHWTDRQQAYDYFHGRKLFKTWTDESVQCYVDFGLKPSSDGGVELCCDPALEGKWFSTLPQRLWASVYSLNCPVSMFMGQETYPFSKRAGVHAQKRNKKITYTEVRGTHCFMQEYPQQAAESVFNAFGDS